MQNPDRASGVLAFSLAISFAGTAAAQEHLTQGPEALSAEALCSSGAPQRGLSRAAAPESSALAAVPFGFLENRGQWDSPARFIGTRGRARIFVEPNALTVAVNGNDGGAAVPVTRFAFEGAAEGAWVEGVDALQGVYNFYTSTAAGAARTENVLRYGQVVLRDLYPGVDVRLRDHEGRLEYDVLLAPGAALDDVVVRCEGIERLELAADGRLLLHTAAGEVLTQSPPTTWAELPEGGTRALDCRYVLLGADRYGYALPERADGLPVVIDPGLEWSTYLGGTGYEEVYALDKDPQGRVIVAGTTNSFGWMLPGVGAPYSVQNGGYDSYVAVLDPAAGGNAQVVWWTFFGGSQNDWIWDIDTNAAGQIFVAGDTYSADFPVTTSAYQQAHVGDWDAYVVMLDPVAGTLAHSTYLGGSAWDTCQRIIVEEPSFVTVAGGTESPDLPTTANAFDGTFDGNRDAYIARFDLSQSGAASLLYSTFVGGTGQDAWVSERQLDIALSPSGVITLVTSSFSSDFPVTANAYRSTNSGGQDPVIAEIDPSVPGAAGLIYGSYIGSPAGEGVSQVELDPSGGYIITGFTYAPTFATTPGAPFRTFLGPTGQNDAWLIRFDPTQTVQYRYATLLPGSGYEGFLQLQVDANGTAYGVGFTGAANLVSNAMPVTCNAFDKTFGGPTDGFIFAITPAGNGPDDVHYLSFFGGDNVDNTIDVLVESAGSTPVLLVGGVSNSLDLPTTANAYQGFVGGGFDGFATRIRLNPYLTCVAGANSVSADGARLCGSGSTSLAANAFQLDVSGLPQNSLGYFLMSTTEVPAFALPTPSQGALCLGGTIVRFAAFVQNSGAGGTLGFTPDLANIPPPGAPLVPGDTAVFQYWYRDNGGTSNTSNGVAVTFD